MDSESRGGWRAEGCDDLLDELFECVVLSCANGLKHSTTLGYGAVRKSDSEMKGKRAGRNRIHLGGLLVQILHSVMACEIV